MKVEKASRGKKGKEERRRRKNGKKRIEMTIIQKNEKQLLKLG